MAEGGPGSRRSFWLGALAVFAGGRLVLEHGGELGRLAGRAAAAALDLPDRLHARLADGLFALGGGVVSARVVAAALALMLLTLAILAVRRS